MIDGQSAVSHQVQNIYTVPARHMGYSLESRWSSRRQQYSEAVREKILSPQENRSSKSLDKRNLVDSYDRLCIKRNHEEDKNAVNDSSIKMRFSQDPQKQQPGNNRTIDELVKHMSSLPGYLQQVGKGKNDQEKALNFGVLDWNRVQNWKYNERMPARVQRKAAPAANNSLYVASRPSSHSSISPQRKQSLFSGSNLSSTGKRMGEGFQQPQQNSLMQDSLAAPVHAIDGRNTNLHQKVKSSYRSSVTQTDKGSTRPVSEKQELSSNQIKRRLSIPLRDIAGAEAPKDMNKMKVENEISLTPQQRPAESQNNVMLVPKHSSEWSSSEISRISESQQLYEDPLAEANRSTLSDSSSPREFPPGTPYPDSGPSTGSVATDNEADMLPQSSTIAQGVVSGKLSHQCKNTIPVTPKSSGAECLESAGCGLDSSVTVEKTVLSGDNIEQSSAKGRHRSPNRRFSFSLGRMTRSFSLKESSAVPQFNSLYTASKSGPVKSDSSFVMDKCNRDKANSSSRGRSSPLRRLLDPLLKPRGPPPAQPVQSSQGNLNSATFKPISIHEPLLKKKNQASTLQALLQLSLRSEVPFFKFAVNNSRDILVAAVKNLPTFENSDLVYAFYSVHEIKKKTGGWLNHGSKGKSCGFGYNIVCQMKISSSILSDCKDKQVTRESVLYNVHTGHEDMQGPDCWPNREIAAVIVKNYSETLKNEGSSNIAEHGKESIGCSLLQTCKNGENDTFKNITVVLPGGFHTLPNKGAPSSLIDRWKSGGSCDCGGWDVGCKLRILTNQVQGSQTFLPSTSPSWLNCLDLYIQGEDQANKPIFSLSLLQDGLYSVAFNASITLLEAFSICVTVITNEQFADILELNKFSGAKVIQGKTRCSGQIKSEMMIQGQRPTKYVSLPPPSPVGRI